MNNRKSLPGELGFSIIFVAFSIFIVISAFQISGTEITLSSPGAFPVFVSIIMLIMSILVWREVKGFSPKGVSDKFKQAINMLFKRDVSGMMILVIIYAIALSLVGFKITTLLFLWASMMFLKAGSWKKNLIISFLTVVVIIVLFSFVFKVILP